MGECRFSCNLCGNNEGLAWGSDARGPSTRHELVARLPKAQSHNCQILLGSDFRAGEHLVKFGRQRWLALGQNMVISDKFGPDSEKAMATSTEAIQLALQWKP